MSALIEKLDSLPSADLEAVAECPLCGSEEYRFLFWNFDRLFHFPGKFGTLSCEGCGLIRLSPRPTLDCIQSYYPATYGAYNNPNAVDQVEGLDQTSIKNRIRRSVLSNFGYGSQATGVLSRVLGSMLTPVFYTRATYGYGDRFPKFVPGGAALEIGCGNGAYLSYLKHHGWSVQGIDLSQHAAAAAKERFDIDVFVGTLDQAPFPSESFDYVHLSHVLEHFFDPIESLRRIFDLLRPGGRVYVEVPNAGGIGSTSSGEYWYGWDAPRHLFMFTPETLEASLTATGFHVTKMSSVPVNSLNWAEIFRTESESGEMETERPGKELNKISHMVATRLKVALKPLSGDFLSCWATKQRTSINK